MNIKVKKLAGWIIWYLAKSSRVLRPLLRPFGMRTSREWFTDRDGPVRFANNRWVRLTKINKSYMAFAMYWQGWNYYEPITILLFRELLRDKDVFLDIGAHIGYYALCAAAEREGLRIIAFEPQPKLCSIITANINANGFNIKCEPLAVSNQAGSADFYMPACDVSGSLECEFRKGHVEVFPVQKVTLDDYMRENNVSGRLLIKMDVEGHEPQALRGALNTLKEFRPELILEVTKDYDAETLKILKDLNYRFYQITNKGFIETDDLTLCIIGDFYFLNYLITTRSREEVNDLFNILRPAYDALDLKMTSLYHRPKSGDSQDS